MGYRNPREIQWKRPVEDYVFDITSENRNREERDEVWLASLESVQKVLSAQLEGTKGVERTLVIRRIHSCLRLSWQSTRWQVLKHLGLPVPTIRTELPNGRDAKDRP